MKNRKNKLQKMKKKKYKIWKKDHDLYNNFGAETNISWKIYQETVKLKIKMKIEYENVTGLHDIFRVK